jgi:HB1, ASXL, restriction endonuclease HTH domain
MPAKTTSTKKAKTMREALILALADGKAKKTKAICADALANWESPRGKTPAASMAAILATDHVKGKDGMFTRTAPGTYKLSAKGKKAAQELAA